MEISLSLHKYRIHVEKEGDQAPLVLIMINICIYIQRQWGPSKITMQVKRIVEQRMLQDDETTAYHLYYMLKEKGLTISVWTIFCCRRELGWTLEAVPTSINKTHK